MHHFPWWSGLHVHMLYRLLIFTINNVGPSTLFSLASSQSLGLVGSGLCTAVMNRSWMKSSSSCRTNQLKTCTGMKTPPVLPCETWELCCVTVSSIPCFLTWKLFTSRDTEHFWDARHPLAWPQPTPTPSRRWPGRWEQCCVCLHTASLSFHAVSAS